MDGGHTLGFELREFGIFALNAHNEEILLYYASLGDIPQHIPPYKSDSVYYVRFPVAVTLSAGDLTVNLMYTQYPYLPVLSPVIPYDQPVGGIWFDNSGPQTGGAENIIIMSNVYYGDDEPGADYGVWIDPDD
jgi:hypothetical protein